MRKKDLENTVERLAFWFMTIMRNLTAFTGLLRLEIDFNFSVSGLIKIVFRVVSQTSENVFYVSDRWFRFRWCVTHALSRHVSWQVTSEWPMRLYNLQTCMNLKTLLLHPTGSTCRWSGDAQNQVTSEWPMRLYNLQTCMNLKTLLLHPTGSTCRWSGDAQNQVTSEWPMRLYNLQTCMNLKTLLLHPTGSTCRWSRDAKNRFAAGLRVDISWGRQWKNHNEI